jgi:putative toxin-antitoxin system antitoxin component (TIGR02293 family)
MGATVKTRAKERDRKAAAFFEKVFHQPLTSEMDVIKISMKGVTKNSLVVFADAFGYSTEKLAAMLPITVRTIQRYSNTHKFNASVSEHIIQLARLMIKGTEVFGSRDNFKRWFATPNIALGGTAPSELVNLKTGTQMVMDELGRIEHGVFA